MGLRPDSYDAFSDVWLIDSDASLPLLDREFFETNCKLVGTNPAELVGVGASWLSSGMVHSAYNHVLPPNSGVPDCALSQGRATAEGAITARSYHGGIVHALTADGGARAFANEIDLDVWRSFGTVMLSSEGF